MGGMVKEEDGFPIENVENDKKGEGVVFIMTWRVLGEDLYLVCSCLLDVW